MKVREKRLLRLLFWGLAVLLFHFICPKTYEQVYADIKTGTVCEPVTVRICSICGEDYDNPEVCPHHIDEEYNGIICSPTGGRICSICGGDYDDGTICAHHEGEEYGGQECSPIRICDICGGNYDDGNECPHHEGESYGGEVCSVEIVLICNICGNDYNDGTVCCHLRDNYYDEWCEPEDTRICSICGHDYDCAGLCPHHEGEIYNEQVCTITRICNICGGNYDDGAECPHHQGDTYGSTECTVTDGRLCNICGHNYDDGNVCPHKIGQQYNGDICEANQKRICNICGENYDNRSECPHKMGVFYEDIAYFFYIPEWIKEAESEKQRLARYYNLTEENVIAIEINSKVGFENAWNEMGRIGEKYYNITGVIIDTHGTSNSLDKSNGVIATINSVQDNLEKKNMDKLVLLGCNVGSIGTSETNIASQFARKIYGSPVVASDGTVNNGTRELNLGFVPFKFQSNGSGWYVYTYHNKEIKVSNSKGNVLTTEQLLSLGT